MVKQGKKMPVARKANLVVYKTVETTRGTKTKLLKIKPSKQYHLPRSTQNSPSKVTSSSTAQQLVEECSLPQFDDDYSMPDPFQIPKHKVIFVFLDCNTSQSILRLKMISFGTGCHSKRNI